MHLYDIVIGFEGPKRSNLKWIACGTLYMPEEIIVQKREQPNNVFN